MRLFCFLLVLLAGSSVAAARDDAPAPPAAGSRSCVYPDPQDGACPHPAFIFDTTAEVCRFEAAPVSRDYEQKCLALAQPFAARRGKLLRLSLRNGATRTYRDSLDEKGCAQSAAGCYDYILYHWFPEHRLFLVNRSAAEEEEWLLVSQLNGREEMIFAPPRYSPDRKWLAAVNYTTHGPDAESGIDIVPATLSPAQPPFHYRPKGRARFEFVRWDGSERLVTKATVPRQATEPGETQPGATQPEETFEVDVVRDNGAWRLKWPRPAPPP
jgi:hypothetical protein